MHVEREQEGLPEPDASEVDTDRVKRLRALLCPRGRARPPSECVEELLLERSGLSLLHIETKLRPGSMEARAVRALAELCEQQLLDADPAVHEWRANWDRGRRRRTVWTDEALREAAVLVGYVRALGYGRIKACSIVQEKLLGRTGHEDTLLTALRRAARRGAFAGRCFKWPTRAEAMAALGWSEAKLPDGAEAESSTPARSRQVKAGESAPIHELLAPDGYVPLWGNRKEDRRKRKT